MKVLLPTSIKFEISNSMIRPDCLTPQYFYYIVIALVTFLFVQHSRFYDPSKNRLWKHTFLCAQTLHFFFCFVYAKLPGRKMLCVVSLSSLRILAKTQNLMECCKQILFQIGI